MAMKKFINDPGNLTAELMEGFAIANGDKIKIESGKIVVRRAPKAQNKVAIVTLGGAGHEPALSGFVGYGALDASVVGDIFAAPAFPKVFEALKMMKREAGILFVILNHEGDVLNGNKALGLAQKEGIRVTPILTHEDIAPGAKAPAESRRGLVGCVPLYKIAGAAAEEGKSLEEVVKIAERFNNQMATLAVALKPATHPANGLSIGEFADDEMEIGMGQHGEAGTGKSKMLGADQTAQVMASRLVEAIGAKKGDKVLVMINGSGATTLMEMYIILRAVKSYLDGLGIEICASRCAEDLTVQEMAGFQMFIAKMDDELLRLWKAPCDTPAMTVR